MDNQYALKIREIEDAKNELRRIIVSSQNDKIEETAQILADCFNFDDRQKAMAKAIIDGMAQTIAALQKEADRYGY